MGLTKYVLKLFEESRGKCQEGGCVLGMAGDGRELNPHLP